MGKFLALFTLAAAVVVGGAVYYLQVYAFYEPVTLAQEPSGPGETRILMSPRKGGRAEPVPVGSFRGIDAASSPLRFRACFEILLPPEELRETYLPYEDPVPLVAPGWFDCFDARAIGAALEEGRAQAFLGEANIRYGIDRVIAVDEAGRAYAWHQINSCGERVFNGEPAPEGCPPPPEGER